MTNDRDFFTRLQKRPLNRWFIHYFGMLKAFIVIFVLWAVIDLVIYSFSTKTQSSKWLAFHPLLTALISTFGMYFYNHTRKWVQSQFKVIGPNSQRRN